MSTLGHRQWRLLAGESVLGGASSLCNQHHELTVTREACAKDNKQKHVRPGKQKQWISAPSICILKHALRCLQVLEGHSDEIFSCAFNYEGDSIITGSKDNTCRIWRA